MKYLRANNKTHRMIRINRHTVSLSCIFLLKKNILVKYYLKYSFVYCFTKVAKNHTLSSSATRKTKTIDQNLDSLCRALSNHVYKHYLKAMAFTCNIKVRNFAISEINMQRFLYVYFNSYCYYEYQISNISHYLLR